MSQSGIGETNWPRRRNGARRRATAPRTMKRNRTFRPAGWLVRIFLLFVIATPSLIVSSPAYASYAAHLPDVSDVAKPMLEADSHAKVRMRKKVRGLRAIEQAVLRRSEAETRDECTPEAAEAGVPSTAAADLAPAGVDAADAVVLDYCAAVRGILNDDQGGPLEPPGLRMAAALDEVRASIERNLGEKKGGSRRSNSADWPDASRAAWRKSRSSRRSSESTSE